MRHADGSKMNEKKEMVRVAYINGEGFGYTVEHGEATLCGVSFIAGRRLDIPAYLDGFPVVALAEGALSSDVRGDILYDNPMWERIVEVHVPATLRRMETNEFYGINQKSVIIDADNPVITVIGDFVYDRCNKKIVAYLNCESEYCRVPEFVKIIGSRAFKGYGNNLRRVELPSGLVEIGDGAFDTQTNIESIDLPKGLKRLGNRALWDCTSLERLNDSADRWALPQGLETLGGGWFFGCSSMQAREIWIPASVKEITLDCWGFNNPYALSFEKISVDPGNKHYCSFDGALYDKRKRALLACPCKKKYLRVPWSVKKIHSMAFDGCEDLTEIAFEGDAPEYSPIDGTTFFPRNARVRIRWGARGWPKCGQWHGIPMA